MSRYVPSAARRLGEALMLALRSNAAIVTQGDLRMGAPKNLVELVVPIGCWKVSLACQNMDFEWVTTRAQVESCTDPTGLAKSLTSRLCETQSLRHRVAEAHGGVMSTHSSLDPRAIMIERATASLLTERHVGLTSVVDHHRSAAIDLGDEAATYCGAPKAWGCDKNVVIALSDGDTAPTLSCRLPVGSGDIPASVRGNVVIVETIIPATLLAASVGRQLGELVATGMPLLDQRSITEAAQIGRRVDITLEPDLITIGEACRGFGGA